MLCNADDMMMRYRWRKEKEARNIVYEINHNFKSQEMETELVSSLTFQSIFTCFWGKKWREAIVRGGLVRCDLALSTSN